MSPDVEKALRHRLILLVGDEEVLRRRFLADLLAGAGLEKDDFDLETFVADGSSPMDWLGSAGTVPFMADRRTAVVRNILRLDADRVPAAALAGLPASSLVILVADDESGSDDRIQRMKTTVRKGWEKLVTGAGGLVKEFSPDSKATRQSVLAEAKARGTAMTPAAVDALVEMTGGSLSRALDELDKLCLFVGDGVQIQEGHVRDIVVASREWNVFRMVEATLEGRVPEALTQLRILVSGNSKAEEAAFRSILPTVSTQLKLVWQARMIVDAGCHVNNVPEGLLAMLPARPNLLKERDWRQNKAITVARHTTLERLAGCLQILSDTDARLKGILGAFNATETLELMVLEMSGTIGARPAPRPY